MGLHAEVFGPAYMDRVLRVDRPLVPPELGPPLDQSVDGSDRFGEGAILELREPSGSVIDVVLPEGWPGPTGTVELSHDLTNHCAGRRAVRGIGWGDDLGGMGAGYAAALEATLHSALGDQGDATSEEVVRLLGEQEIRHEPFRVRGHPADWTLLVTSGEYGDKLAVGFRGCHGAIETGSLSAHLRRQSDLRVVAALPNRLASLLLTAPGARCRLFAPAMRNMRDRDVPVSGFAGSIDVLCCNRREWEVLEDREEVAWRVSILVVTEGPAGASARFTKPTGDPGIVRVPAFPRSRPPRDTNRAGEAFAATLVRRLLDRGWDPASTIVEEAVIRSAMLRASVASALVLDRAGFGFPDAAEIEAAIEAGTVR
jgi:ribokinase